jgi:hypothetical protein
MDITVNKLFGTLKLPLLEFFDVKQSQNNHLFKKSLVLIKAWLQFEARLLGSAKGLLATYAVEVMLLSILSTSQQNDQRQQPFNVLCGFLAHYSQFDWENLAVTATGVVPVSQVEHYKTGGWVSDFLKVFGWSSLAASGGFPAFKTGLVNIVDPLNEKNNLGRSMSNLINFHRMQAAFKFGNQLIQKILISNDPEQLRNFFAVTLSKGLIPLRSCIVPIAGSSSPFRAPERKKVIYNTKLNSDVNEILLTYVAGHPEEKEKVKELSFLSGFLRKPKFERHSQKNPGKMRPPASSILEQRALNFLMFAPKTAHLPSNQPNKTPDIFQ